MLRVDPPLLCAYVCRQRRRRLTWSSTSFTISRRASRTHVSMQVRRPPRNSWSSWAKRVVPASKCKCIFLCLALSAEGGVDSGQGSSVFSSDSPHLGQLTMSYSCPPSSQPPSQPQTPYPATPSAAPQQHPGYAQPPQPMVSG